jgi:hypothetical protein
MRLRVRVSIRVLMVVVALSAICAGPGYKWVQVLRKRSLDYRETAKTSASMIAWLKVSVKNPYLTDEERRSRQQLLGWYERRIGPYTRAASRPWIIVVDEPRPPLVWSKPKPVTPIQVEKFVVRKPPKDPRQMTDAEKGQYGLQLLQDLKDYGVRLDLARAKLGGFRGKIFSATEDDSK